MQVGYQLCVHSCSQVEGLTRSEMLVGHIDNINIEYKYKYKQTNINKYINI
jgi:hypothetical protein